MHRPASSTRRPTSSTCRPTYLAVLAMHTTQAVWNHRGMHHRQHTTPIPYACQLDLSRSDARVLTHAKTHRHTRTYARTHMQMHCLHTQPQGGTHARVRTNKHMCVHTRTHKCTACTPHCRDGPSSPAMRLPALSAAAGHGLSAAATPTHARPPISSPTSGLSTPCPDGHSDPCYRLVATPPPRAQLPAGWHNVLAGGAGAQAAMSLFGCDGKEGAVQGSPQAFGSRCFPSGDSSCSVSAGVQGPRASAGGAPASGHSAGRRPSPHSFAFGGHGGQGSPAAAAGTPDNGPAWCCDGGNEVSSPAAASTLEGALSPPGAGVATPRALISTLQQGCGAAPHGGDDGMACRGPAAAVAVQSAAAAGEPRAQVRPQRGMQLQAHPACPPQTCLKQG